jgi:hypothetical protein
VPGSPTTRSVHKRWLHHFQTLVADGVWAWLEITDSDLFVKPLPAGIVASAFANTDVYLLLANYTRTPVTIVTRENYVSLRQERAAISVATGRTIAPIRVNR